MQRVKRVLMCRPTYFDVEYIINPHMKPHAVDQALAMQQWEGLVAALESQGVKVEIIEQKPDVPDMVFATDQGIVEGGTVLMANFRYPERKPETRYYRAWFREHGFEPRELTKIFNFEGGDALFVGKMLIVGTGFRANVASCEELADNLGIDVVPVRLVDPLFYHLDTCFLPLDADTAFYYPPAFSENSQGLLKKLIPNLHEMSRTEAEGFSANSLVSGDTVILQAGNPTFRKKLEKLGRKVIEVEVGEFNKSGGGIHCLINTLEKT
ncbi:MAG TPA: arginine deiminase family protein [Candidatus Saccharimonadia bacterium]|nr:arginine deiminase family protein [Candidatus Saccharimonadia bacterium]